MAIRLPRSQRRALEFACVAWIICLPILSRGAQEIIPVPSPGTDGPTWSHVPFSGLTLTEVPPMRFQQVYASSVFSTLSPDGGLITGLRFVSDAQVGRGWGASLPRVEISMSVTPNDPDGLSAIFDENLGASITTVFSSGPLLLVSADRGSFVNLSFQTPFFYNPSDGNLLLEIRNYEPTIFPGVPQANAGPLDAWNVTGDPISRVYSIGNADATTGIADTLGLTTYFVVTPVPEPASLALFALALGIGACWRLRVRRRSIKR